MTLQDLGNISQFIGAIGVIVSLVYLAVQIRQNTKSIRASTFQELVRDMTATSDLLASNPELSRIWWTGMRDLDSLNAGEMRRFSSYMLGFFRRMENIVYQAEQGALDPAAWEGWRNVLRRTLSHPGGAAWWARSQHFFGQRFREYVDRELTSDDKDAA